MQRKETILRKGGESWKAENANDATLVMLVSLLSRRLGTEGSLSRVTLDVSTNCYERCRTLVSQLDIIEQKCLNIRYI